MDIIFIDNLEVETVIGVYDWERSIRQKLVVDLTLGWDVRLAAEQDNIALSLDYALITQHVQAFSENSSFKLVESYAENLSAMLLDIFKVPWLRLRVSKPGAVSSARTVGVEIERGCR